MKPVQGTGSRPVGLVNGLRSHQFRRKIKHTFKTEAEETLGVEWVDLDQLLKRADVVSLPLQLIAENAGLIGADQQHRLGPSNLADRGF